MSRTFPRRTGRSASDVCKIGALHRPLSITEPSFGVEEVQNRLAPATFARSVPRRLSGCLAPTAGVDSHFEGKRLKASSFSGRYENPESRPPTSRAGDSLFFPDLEDGAAAMGVMRFLLPRRDRLPADVVERAYMAGLDEIPWQARGPIGSMADWSSSGRKATPAICSFPTRSRDMAS